MTAERQKVLDAIKSLGHRVTVSDVAAKTGLPLLAAGQHLNSIAADCKATMQVSKDGNIVYRFAPAFETAYLATGFMWAVQQFGEKTFELAYYVLRMSFGVTLIASVITVAILVIIALIAILSKFDGGGGGGGGDSGGGFDLNFDWLGDCANFFTWDVNYGSSGSIAKHSHGHQSNHHGGGHDYDAYLQGKYVPAGQSETSEQKQGFVLNCFSYLFGDGNPNEHIEEQKWQLIAEHIRKNNGVMTAEQLSCFTGGNPRKEEHALPVLVRFDGHPEVTDTGHIMYVFPSLQVTANRPEKRHHAQLPDYLEEKKWPFSRQEAAVFIPVVIFVVLNFTGCMWLLGHIGKVAVLYKVRYLIDWLSVYATFFLLFPVVRWGFLELINQKTALRNFKRRRNLRYLTQKGQQKLLEAQQYSQKMKAITADQVVYSTDKDVLEQQFER